MKERTAHQDEQRVSQGTCIDLINVRCRPGGRYRVSSCRICAAACRADDDAAALERQLTGYSRQLCSISRARLRSVILASGHCRTRHRIDHNDRRAFEIRIDGTPRTFRDRSFAMEAARLIKSKNPRSMVEIKDLQSGGVTAVALRPG